MLRQNKVIMVQCKKCKNKIVVRTKGDVVFTTEKCVKCVCIDFDIHISTFIKQVKYMLLNGSIA